MVYVLNREGKAIMPTERHGKVRRLLRDGRAHVVRLQPFTIQLDYDSKSYTQEVSLGVDAGSVHIGVSATTKEKELFAAEFSIRKNIRRKIAERFELRRSRRYRKTRYRQQRILNRKRDGTRPSIRYIVDCHLKVIDLLHFLLPINMTIIEVAQFDIQKIVNTSIQGKEYCEGEQMGTWNVREYVLARDNHTCQYCYGKSGDKILNVHHIESRLIGGNAPNNLITLCRKCHNAYHKGLIKLDVQRGLPLKDAAVMNRVRWSIYTKVKEKYSNVHITFGYITKYKRINGNLEKSHHADAFCISKNMQAERLTIFFKGKFIPRHYRSMHRSTPQKRGIRRKTNPSHWIGKSRLQKYDNVIWNGIPCFISGSTHGYPTLGDIEGRRVTPSSYVRACRVIFKQRNKSYIMQRISNEWI